MVLQLVDTPSRWRVEVAGNRRDTTERIWTPVAMQEWTDRQRKSSRESFGVFRTGVWLGNDPVFSDRAVYQKCAKPTAADADGRSEGHCVLPVANNRQLRSALQTEVEWQERGNPGSTAEIRHLAPRRFS